MKITMKFKSIEISMEETNTKPETGFSGTLIRYGDHQKLLIHTLESMANTIIRMAVESQTPVDEYKYEPIKLTKE